MKLTLASCVVIFSLFCLPTIAQNLEPARLAVAPAINEIVVDPGESVSHVIRLTNTASQQVVVSARTNTLTPDDYVLDDTKKEQFDAAFWLSLEKSDYILDANETRSIPINIEVPKNASAGGHYATVRFKPMQLAAANETVKIEPEVSALLFITVSGDINEEITFQNFDAPSYSNVRQIPLEFSIANTGDNHNIVRSKLIIKKSSEIVYEQEINPEVILPNTYKIFNLDWKPKSWGSYTAQIITSYGSSNIEVESHSKTIRIGPDIRYIFGVFVVCSTTALIIIKKQTKKVKN